jgi:hypothetical protein
LPEQEFWLTVIIHPGKSSNHPKDEKPLPNPARASKVIQSAAQPRLARNCVIAPGFSGNSPDLSPIVSQNSGAQAEKLVRPVSASMNLIPCSLSNAANRMFSLLIFPFHLTENRRQKTENGTRRLYRRHPAAADGTPAALLRYKGQTTGKNPVYRRDKKGIKRNNAEMLRLNNGIFTATFAPTETKTAFTRVLVAQQYLRIL